MNNYTLWCFGYHSAAWGREDSMNCPNSPECVTYIPAYTTKLRPVNKTISKGQTTQRNSHSVNMCRILITTDTHKNHLKFRCTSVSPVLWMQTAFQSIYADWGSSACFNNAHTVWHRNKVLVLLLLLLSFTCRTGMFTRWVLPCAVYIRLYKATGEGLLETARKQVQWKPAIWAQDWTFPSLRLHIHISKRIF